MVTGDMPMSFGLTLNLDPRLWKLMFRQMLPILAQTPVYRHVGPIPETNNAEQETQTYVQNLRRDALAINGEWGQRVKGVWAGIRQFGTLAVAGFVDTILPLPEGFAKCLVHRECKSFAVATQDIAGDTLNFLTMVPAQMVQYFLDDHSHSTEFDRAYAGTQTTVLGGLLAANLLGLSKLKMPTQTPDMMLPPSFQLSHEIAVSSSITIDGLSAGKWGSGIMMMDSSGGASGGSRPDRITSDDVRAATMFDPTSPGQVAARVGARKFNIMQLMFSKYRGFSEIMIMNLRGLQEGRITPDQFIQSTIQLLQSTEDMMMREISASAIPFDTSARGTLIANLRSQFVEALRFSMRDLFKHHREGPLVLPRDVDTLLRGWSRDIETFGWAERDMGLLITQLDYLYNVDLTLIRVRKGVFVPMEHVMAAIERAAYQTLVDYEQMAKVLRSGTTERVLQTVLSKVMQNFERTGVLMEAAAEKIKHGESTRITPQLGRVMDALPVYATQIEMVDGKFFGQNSSLILQSRLFLEAYPHVMGRALPPEAAALARRLSEITN
jgi:hypothetical protein